MNFVLRPWQEAAFNELRNEALRIINALTGSGKSYLMLHMALDENIREDRKSIICMPQEVISASFVDNTPHIIDNKIIKNVSDYIVNTFDFQKKQKVIKEFRNSDKAILLCSYQTFITAYTANKKMFDGMEIYVDETHHVKAYEDKEFSNKMGAIIYDLYKKNKTHITLSSATLFRGDKIDILDSKIKDAFVRYNLDIDDYLHGLKYLKHIQIDVETYDISNPFEKVKKAYKSGKKMIIYIPHVNTQEHKMVGTKDDWRDGMIAAVGHANSKVYGPDENGIYTIKNGKEVEVLDLITDETKQRRNAKRHLIANQKSDENIDVILALGMMKEGANFIYASEAHIFGVPGSIKDVVQILGRITRDAPGKKIARLVIHVPLNKKTSGPQFKEDVEDYVKASLMSMILDDVIFNSESIAKKKEGMSSGPKANTAWDDIQSEDRIRLYQDVSDVLFNMDEDCSVEQFMEAIREVVNTDSSTEYLDDVDQKFITKHLYKTQVYNKLKLDGVKIDMSSIDYKVMQEVGHPMGWLTKMTSKEFGIDRFRALRAACSVAKFTGTPETLKEYAKSLGIKYESQWLKHCRENPEEIGDRFPFRPSKTNGWEHTFPTNKRYSGTREELLELARKNNITNESQWKRFCRLNPEEVRDKFPVLPNEAKGFEGTFKLANARKFTGTVEELRNYANQRGIICNHQWVAYCRKNPDEIRGRFPFDTCIVSGWEHTFEKYKPTLGTPEYMKSEAQKYGITNFNQWYFEFPNHPEWDGILPRHPNPQKSRFKDVFKD